jgi:TRAP-type C4-dicarboxylate transport system substrate-binding protein
LQGYAANLAWWNSLSEGDRRIVGEGMSVAEKHCRTRIIEDRKSLALNYTQQGMTVTSLSSDMAEFRTWAAATAPILARVERTLSAEILAPVHKQLAR